MPKYQFRFSTIPGSPDDEVYFIETETIEGVGVGSDHGFEWKWDGQDSTALLVVPDDPALTKSIAAWKATAKKYRSQFISMVNIFNITQSTAYNEYKKLVVLQEKQRELVEVLEKIAAGPVSIDKVKLLIQMETVKNIARDALANR